MMMSEDEKKAESATDKLRTLLRNIENIADRALGTQPYDEVPCWEHLVAALGKIETEMLIHTAEKPLDPNAPEMVRGGNSHAEPQSRGEEEIENHQTTEPQNHQTEEKKAIGNFGGVGKVVSYAIDKNLAVTVTARTTDGRTWMFKGIKNGETAIMGTILGGKATAVRYCKFIRNGIVSRLMKIKQNHARRAEKAASALADAHPDAAEPTNH